MTTFDEVENDDEEFDDDDEAISGSIQDLEDRLDAEARKIDPSMDDDEEDIDEDLDFETYVAEDVAFLVGALATIADPVAHKTIKTTFREGLVDESMTSKEQVADLCRSETMGPRRRSRLELAGLLSNGLRGASGGNRAIAGARVPRSKYRYEDRYDEGEPPPDIPATAPIRNAQSKAGKERSVLVR